MNELQRTCATCPSFNPIRDEQSELMSKGECRARPPVVHMLVIPGADQGGRVVGMVQQPAIMGQTVFPTVTHDAWCAFHPEREIGGGVARLVAFLSD